MLFLFFGIFTIVLAEDTILPSIKEAELLYEQKNFSSLVSELSKIRALPNLNKITLGAINRLEGHICLFGKKKDKNIDLSCAWKKYAEASRYGDIEGMFYAAFILNNFLFDTLDPLKEQFGEKVAIILIFTLEILIK